MDKKDAVVMEHGRSEEQLKVMRQIQQDGVDPFSWDLLHRYHREPVIRQGEFWLITPNDYPYEGAVLHLLLIYRDRVRQISEIEPAGWSELQDHLRWIEQEHQLGHGTLLMRFGEPAATGGSVDHLHLHVIVGKPSGSQKLKVTAGYKA